MTTLERRAIKVPVGVVTDSCCDLPPQITEELGIKNVPFNVILGDRSFKDRIEIALEEFYERLDRDPIYPTTAQPSPNDFQTTYERLIKEGIEEIISITISRKLSGTFNAACLAAKEIIQKGERCQIEVMDSQGVGMWQGFLAMLAARLAHQGKGLSEIVDEVRENISRLHVVAILDNLEYAKRGGRLGKASFLAELLNGLQRIGFVGIKPALRLGEGVALPDRLRFVKKSKRVEHLVKFAKSFPRIKEIAIEHSMDKANEWEVKKLKDEIKSAFSDVFIYVTKIGPVIGAHTGPGTLAVVVREG